MYALELEQAIKEKYQAEGIRVSFPPGTSLSICRHCGNPCAWERMLDEGESYTDHPGKWRMVYPASSSMPLPAEDMPEHIQQIYREARFIAGISPRGAAALLRLCLQELMLILGEEGKNLYRDIGGLVKKGVLSPQIQRAMDGVRFFGNAAVHPGTINLNDDPDTALTLFELLNLIVEQTISAERKSSELFAKIPKNNRDAIARRDGKQSAEDSE